MSKLDVTMKALRARLRAANRPIAAWSSGLDSMTVLHMARQIVPEIPVLFLHEKFQTHKLEFAKQTIADWKLQVAALPCLHRDIVMQGEEAEIYQLYPLGVEDRLVVPLGINASFDETNFKCALDLVRKPCATLPDGYQFPWDLVLHGQRGDDVDPIHGNLSLAQPVLIGAQTTLFYPLHDWTRAEVVAYVREHKLPFEARRYNAENDFREFSDKTFNLDYLDICTRCVLQGAHAPQRVRCPKINEDVDTITIPDRRAAWRTRLQLGERYE